MYIQTHRQLKVIPGKANGEDDGPSGSGTDSYASSFSKTVPLQRESLNQQTQRVADPLSFSPIPMQGKKILATGEAIFLNSIKHSISDFNLFLSWRT